MPYSLHFPFVCMIFIIYQAYIFLWIVRSFNLVYNFFFILSFDFGTYFISFFLKKKKSSSLFYSWVLINRIMGSSCSKTRLDSLSLLGKKKILLPKLVYYLMFQFRIAWIMKVDIQRVLLEVRFLLACVGLHEVHLLED